MARKLFWRAALLVAAAAVGAGLSWKPWKAYLEQRREADRHVAEMREAEQNRANLMRRKTQLESTPGREQQAREAGYLKPGERSAGITTVK